MVDDCACLYGDEGETPDFFSRAWVTARKPHTCIECRGTIPIGARYERESGKWDGKMSTFRTCAECQDIRESLYCESWSFGNLWEDVENQLFAETGLTISCVDKLTTPEAKRFLQRRWMTYIERKGGEPMPTT